MFISRSQAAKELANKLGVEGMDQPLVLAIPRGGAIIGDIVAENLHTTCDIILTRRVRLPHYPEITIGAVAEDGTCYFDDEVTKHLDLEDEQIDQEIENSKHEIASLRKWMRRPYPPLGIKGRHVILVDDGMATGARMISTLMVIRAQVPRSVIVAVPVAPKAVIERVKRYCDHVFCLEPQEHFQTIGHYYQDYHQVTNDDVRRVIRKYAHIVHSKSSVENRKLG